MLNENYDDSPEIYTVSQLNQTVRLILEDNFPSVWVEGEISNLARPASGHLYFTLKDTLAQIRCAFFQTRQRHINFRPENGLLVKVRARVSLYEGRGDYQLIIEEMEEAGDGALRRAFELLKQRLAAEGLFNPAHKKPLPTIPRTIGVITSPSGAAIRDILSVLRRRFASIPVIIYPTAVQGKEAGQQIIKALSTANQRDECDVLILARGGGSLEDLWPFNEEAVARAIYASEIPLISGIGHEIDFTIADFVADHRAPTPSAAAELVSPDHHKWQQDLANLQQRLMRCMSHLIDRTQHILASLTKRLRHPRQLLQEQSQRLDYCEQNLQRIMQHLFQQKRSQLVALSRALETISPLATLNRGYAIVTHKTTGAIVYQASALTVGDNIVTQLGEGSFEAVVNKTQS